MSNSESDKIWTIDTAEEYLALGESVCLAGLEWHPNAVDDDLLIQDGNDSDIWRIRATTASGSNHEDAGILTKTWPEGQWFDGFDVTTIDGGTLYVFLK